MTALRLLRIFTVAAMAVQAQTAILECVSAANASGRFRLVFRIPGAGLPRVERATLFLRVSAGSAPQSLKLNGRTTSAVPQERGWLTVAVPIRDALKPLKLETGGVAIHGCANRENAPYLVIEQTSPPRGRQDK
ncbi:MAG: hypothetical protein HY821_11020 [Acidobacteria bacterium]|nr:hypothetical protein [Acidobacteriota bacterium]